MTSLIWTASARDARNAALVEAEVQRTLATHDAEVEYSETVAKVRERYRADLADAAAHRLRSVRAAHQAYNRAVVAAERIDAYLG
jgi:hypothetical protein